MPLVDTFFESDGVGEFSLANLSLIMVNDRKRLDEVEPETDEERLDAWLADTAYFHELRHYHDLVGSVCGLHTFLESTAWVDRILTALAESEGEITVPIRKRQPDSAIATLHRSYKRFMDVVIGDGEIRPAPDDSELRHSIVEFASEDPPVTTRYPLAPIPKQNGLTGEFEEFAHPVGLRALMELTATEIQFVLSAVGAGKDEDDMAPRALRYLDLCGRLFRGGYTRYFSARLIAEYDRMQRRGLPPARTTPPMAMLMPIAQTALDFSGYQAIATPWGGHSWEFEHPGLAYFHFLGELSAELEKKSLTEIANAVSKACVNASYDDYLASYVRRLEEGREHMPQRLSPEAATNGIVRYIRKAVVNEHLVLMRSKRDHLQSWLHPYDYLENCDKLPLPPLRFVSGEFRVRREDMDGVQFVIWTFLIAFVEGILEHGEVRCPIRHHMRAAGRFMAFPDIERALPRTSCTAYIDSSACGAYNGAFASTQPMACPFAYLTQKFIKEWGRNVTFRGG
ncbi:hypothetical protein [Methylocystis parvus]|uniref:Uncharacterized protein n=1 Tax=Methylocystis parvus TaxID=134 RepID=A0A6B8M2W9_9HYPH|nr:hypothetical protein [Methylocystis parvus]QGM96666.1 hypothetical protein F7D14_03660 [Methylocystis parvus]WBJ99472.1 hypothetical protein MMG94_15975 [Methylocystis parvus OBBP]